MKENLGSNIIDIEGKAKAINDAETAMEGMTVSAYNVMMQLQETLLASYCVENQISPTEVIFQTVTIPGKHGPGWGTYCLPNKSLGI